MKNKFIITTIISIAFAGGLIAFANNSAIQFDPKTQQKQESTKTTLQVAEKTTITPSINTNEYVMANSLDIVATPDKFLNKKVKFKASFDKFSTLGLD